MAVDDALDWFFDGLASLDLMQSLVVVLRCDAGDIGTAALDARLADLVKTIRVHCERP